jgi:hypothetical protein
VNLRFHATKNPFPVGLHHPHCANQPTVSDAIMKTSRLYGISPHWRAWYNPIRPPPRAPPPQCVDGGGKEEIMSDPHDDAKLAKLIDIQGYESIEALMEAVFSDSVSLPCA